MIRAIMFLTVCVTMTGCQQAKTFMHMNSDSPSPFFGLQLAVDRETPSVSAPSVSAPSTAHQRAREAELQDTGGDFLTVSRAGEFIGSPANAYDPIDQTLSQKADQPSGSSRFSFTAREAQMSGDLVHALPRNKPRAGSSEANQVAELLARLNRSN